jgi:hypothetical protein
MSSVRVKANCETRARKIFDEMWSGISVNASGGFPYPDFFTHDDYLPLLLPLFEMDKTITPDEQADLLSRSFTTIRRANRKDFQAFVDALNAKVRAMMAMPKETFYLATTVSYRKDSVNPAFAKRVDRSIITIRQHYPRKLRTKEWFHNGLGKVDPGEPSSYACLYAKIKARTQDQAVQTMLADTELLLACLNLAHRSGRYVIAPTPIRPFNTVRTGKFQQVHDNKGKVDRTIVWHDAEYKEESNLISFADHQVKLRKYIAEFFYCLGRSRLREITEAGLRQYHGALNMRDRQLCLIRLWAALEILMQSNGNSRVTARRAAFFSRKQDYRKDKLIHVADMRNSYVHAGTAITLADKLVDDLRLFMGEIITVMIFSEIKNMAPGEFVQMLDLPHDPKLMKEKIAIVRMGLKVRQ